MHNMLAGTVLLRVGLSLLKQDKNRTCKTDFKNTKTCGGFLEVSWMVMFAVDVSLYTLVLTVARESNCIQSFELPVQSV